MIHKTNLDGYVKDMKTNAVLNVNNNALEAYKRQREKYKHFEDINTNVNNLRNEVSEIKKLLKELINK